MTQTIERKILKFIIKESLKGALRDAGASLAQGVINGVKAEMARQAKEAKKKGA